MSKRSFTELVWKEVSYPRPFDEEKICEILSHIAVVTPRGPVIMEARSHGGYVKHYIGADSKYITKLENTIKAHGDIQFYPVNEQLREDKRQYALDCTICDAYKDSSGSDTYRDGTAEKVGYKV